jgi:hypothetical protein
VTASPWRAALGGRFDELAPGLHAYFSPMPAGSVGVGTGIFDVVGTPRRWLWPVLALLALERIVWPVWQRAVPFTVANRYDDGVVRAEREFRFPQGARTMVDAIVARGDSVVDRVGTHGLLEVEFALAVVDGGLILASTRTALRLGRVRLPIPRAFAPRMRIEERALPGGRQRVSFTLDAPGLGRLYEYTGEFTYRQDSA